MSPKLVLSILTCFLSLSQLAGIASAFSVSGAPIGQRLQSSMKAATIDFGCTTTSTENYDIVKVDLDDGRDYPIYIGTGYSEQEGTEHYPKSQPLR